MSSSSLPRGLRLDRHSLRWRLPLLISALIFLVLLTFLGVTYRQVTRLQVEAATARAQLAANQLAESVQDEDSLAVSLGSNLVENLHHNLEGSVPALRLPSVWE